MNIKHVIGITSIFLTFIAMISIYGTLTGVNIDLPKIFKYMSNFEFNGVHAKIMQAGAYINQATNAIENIGTSWKSVNNIIDGIVAIYDTIVGIGKAMFMYFMSTLQIVQIPFIAIIDLIKGIFGFFGTTYTE